MRRRYLIVLLTSAALLMTLPLSGCGSASVQSDGAKASETSQNNDADTAQDDAKEDAAEDVTAEDVAAEDTKDEEADEVAAEESSMEDTADDSNDGKKTANSKVAEAMEKHAKTESNNDKNDDKAGSNSEIDKYIEYRKGLDDEIDADMMSDALINVGAFYQSGDVSEITEYDNLADWIMIAKYCMYSKLPLEVIEDEAPAPEYIEFTGIEKGDTADKIWCNKSDAERIISDIVGKKATVSDCDFDNCLYIHDGVIEEWAHGWMPVVEGYAPDIVESDYWFEGKDLNVRTILNYDNYAAGLRYYRYIIDSTWKKNDDSFLGWSLDSWTTQNAVQDLTEEIVEELREDIKYEIDHGLTDEITKTDKVDNIPYKRRYNIFDDDLVFAYYYGATDGSPDLRFYFHNNTLVRMCKGSGSNQVQYNLTGGSLPSDFFEWEETVLEMP